MMACKQRGVDARVALPANAVPAQNPKSPPVDLLARLMLGAQHHRRVTIMAVIHFLCNQSVGTMA